MAKDRSPAERRTITEGSRTLEKRRCEPGEMGSTLKQPESRAKKARHSRVSPTLRKRDREQKATNVIQHDLPRPWLNWRNEDGRYDLAWIPVEIQAGLDKLDGCSPWLQYMVYAKAWYVFTGPQQTERATGGEELVPPVPSAAPSMPPTPPTQAHATDAGDVIYSQDSGYMSDLASSERPGKETPAAVESSRTPNESISSPGNGDGGEEPTPGGSAGEDSEYMVTLQEPGSSRRTIYCSDKLSTANRFARKVFGGVCDYRLGQSELILTRAYRARCKPLEAKKWFAGDGTVRLEWCDGLGREGRVAVERQSVRVSATVDAT